jgi:enterochelin esterase family protein
VGSLGLLSTPGDIPFEPPFEQAQATALADRERANALHLFWIACGRDDPFLAEARQVSETLTRHKIRHVWGETDGAHNWITWRRYWAELAPQLFRP